MDVSGITDETSLRAWLDARDLPRRVLLDLAQRAGARAWYCGLWSKVEEQQRPQGPMVVQTQGLDDDPRRLVLLGRVLILSGGSDLPDAAQRAAILRTVSMVQERAGTAPQYQQAACDSVQALAQAVLASAKAAPDALVAHVARAIAASVEQPFRQTGRHFFHAWEAERHDLGLAETGRLAPHAPLGSKDDPRQADTFIHGTDKAKWLWPFWFDWITGLLSGRPLPQALLHRIAGLPDDLWLDPDRLAERIAEHYPPASAPVPAPPAEAIPLPPATTIRSQTERNRAVLPPTLAAIEGLIALEIDRLQRINYTDDAHMAECKRLIGVFTALAGAARGLAALIPATGPVTDSTAQEMTPLIRVYLEAATAWPRENAADLVDGTARLGLIALTTTLLTGLGMPALAAVGMAGLTYGGRKLVDAAREMAHGPGSA